MTQKRPLTKFISYYQSDERTGVGVDKELSVSRSEDVKDGGFVEVSQVSHVFALVVLGRVAFHDIVLFFCQILFSKDSLLPP